MKNIFKTVFVILLLVGPFTCVYAQDEIEFPALKEIKGKKLLVKIAPLQNQKTKLWGYADSEGKFIIKPVFEEAQKYEGTYARIKVKGKWGVIDNRGLYQFLPKYDRLCAFSADSLAIAEVNGKMGLITPKGAMISRFDYESLEYASYGYLVKKGGQYGTMGHDGKTLLEPCFDKVAQFDNSSSLEHVQKDGKWGLMRDGISFTMMEWDEKLSFFQSGVDGLPDLYLVRKGNRIGVMTVEGRVVVPCVYDEIEKSSSGEYYITRRDGLYGALTLKMGELIPPILQTKPFIGNNIFRIHDDGRFFCANVNGCIRFEDCADLYSVFQPEEYRITKYFPEWAKVHIIDENLIARQAKLDNARAILDSGNSTISPEAVEKYGLTSNGPFVRTSGSFEEYTLFYKATDGPENDIYLMGDLTEKEYLIRLDDVSIPLGPAIRKFNIRKFSAIYPKGFARVSDSEVLIHFAFVRKPEETGTSLVEDNPYLIPVDAYSYNVYLGASDSKKESHAVLKFSTDSLAVVSFTELSSNTNNSIKASNFGGFYMGKSTAVLADESTPLIRHDRNGVFDWNFQPLAGETIFDMDETENYIYLCGSVKNNKEETPLLVQLTKRGDLVGRKYKEDINARFTGIICKDYLLYTKLNGAYEPTFNLEDMGDNVGVRLSCAWDEWGTGMVGGLGLVDEKGTWLQTPILSTDQMGTAFDWEFSGFNGDYLIVRHMGLFGLVNRNGELVVETKYNTLEQLQNPGYFKASRNGQYGVIDVSGREIVPLRYSYVGNMSEDVIIVCQDGIYGTFDKEGRVIVPVDPDSGNKIEEIREYVGGMARIKYKDRFGFINQKGEEIVAPFSDEVENFSEGYSLVTVKNKKGFVSLAGDWIAPPMYDTGGTFSGGLAMLAMGGKYGYIDRSGNFVIPMQFDAAKDFDIRASLACVSKDGKWGVINKIGEMILPCAYDTVTITTDQYIYVERAGKVGIYSNEGVEIFPIMCDGINLKNGGRLFKCGVAEGFLNGQRINIDEQGNTVYQYSLQRK